MRDTMNIKKMATKHGVTEVMIKGTDVTFMNSLRRATMNSVPNFAIEDVIIYENNSVMFDEFLANRLGLIPIKTEGKKFKEEEKVKFILEKEGPGTVYSKDMKSTDPKIDVADKRIPIVKLQKGQKIKIEMDAVVGFGKQHTKWQPAIVSYRQMSTLTLKDNATTKSIQVCTTHVPEVKAKKIDLVDSANCILCGNEAELAHNKDLSLEYSEDSFVMAIEPHGGMDTKEILLLAAEALQEKAKEFEKELKKFE